MKAKAFLPLLGPCNIMCSLGGIPFPELSWDSAHAGGSDATRAPPALSLHRCHSARTGSTSSFLEHPPGPTTQLRACHRAQHTLYFQHKCILKRSKKSNQSHSTNCPAGRIPVKKKKKNLVCRCHHLIEGKHAKLQYTDDTTAQFNWQRLKQNSGFSIPPIIRFNSFNVCSLKPYNTCCYKMKCVTKSHLDRISHWRGFLQRNLNYWAVRMKLFGMIFIKPLWGMTLMKCF